MIGNKDHNIELENMETVKYICKECFNPTYIQEKTYKKAIALILKRKKKCVNCMMTLRTEKQNIAKAKFKAKNKNINKGKIND